MGLFRSPKFQKVDFWKPRDDNTKNCPLLSPPSPLGDFRHQKRPKRVLFYAFNGTLRKFSVGISVNNCKLMDIFLTYNSSSVCFTEIFHQLCSSFVFSELGGSEIRALKKSHKPTLRPIRLAFSEVLTSN